MSTPRFAWGIDVGNRALKAIKVVRDGEQLRIDDFEVIEHEQILSQAGDNRDSLVQSALANFAQKHKAKGGGVAISVSGQQSFARFIKLPPVDPTKIGDIVKFEAVQQIPFPLNDVEWSYQLFQTPDSPEVEVGIFAMRRDLVNQTIQIFTDVGLEVTTVQMSPLAVYNGLYADGRIEGTTMIVDVGAENTDLIIAEGENIWMRSIPIGGNNFTEALVKSFQLKFPKAEEMKRNAATSKYGRQILQAMKPVFSDLVGEIQRSIGFYSSTHRDSRIGKVLALGGTFRLPGLLKYLQQNLQLEVMRIDHLNAPSPAEAKFAAEFNENILSSVGAYGLAVQAMGQGKVKSSLLPEKIRRERMWREKTIWFAVAASLFVAGTSISIGKLYADRYAFESQDPIRSQINVTSVKAKKLDHQWRADVETSGAEDRSQITNYLTLLADRDLSIRIAEEIGKAIPATDPREMQKPRAERKSVELVSWTMQYQSDVAPLLGMTEDEFNQLSKGEKDAVAAQAAPAIRSFGPGGAPMHMPRGMYRPGLPSPAAPAPKPEASTGVGQRGFLLTITCRTPAQDPTRLVADTVAAALRLRKQNALDAPKGFSIERVTIPSKMKMTAVYPSGTIPQNVKQPLVFVPPVASSDNGSGGGQAFTPYTPPGGAFVPPGFPGQVGLHGAASGPELYPDPMHKGESMANDSLVTILAAVVIDPPPLPKPDDRK